MMFTQPSSLLVLLLTFCAFSTPTGLAQTTKIMLVGDSITHGDRNNNDAIGYADGGVGFRYPLFFNLVDQGIEVDFVGSLSVPQHGNPPRSEPNYPRYYIDFDRDHEGHSGWRTDQILRNGNFTLADSLSKHLPDVVSILIGANDILQNRSLSDATSNVGKIIDTIREYNPDTKILLSLATPLGTSQAANVPTFNATLPTLVAEKNSIKGATPVTIVDQFSGFDEFALTYDAIHPNEYGEQLMADRYYVALQKVLDPSAKVKSPNISVGNGSFEDHPSHDGSIVSKMQGKGRGQAFRFHSSKVADAGLYNPLANTYSGAGGDDGTPQGADGKLVGFLFNNGDLGDKPENASSISQQLGAVLMPGQEYTLTVAIGRRAQANQYRSIYGGYVIELLAGETVIGSEKDAILPNLGMFADASFSILSDDLDPALLGSELSIRLRMSTLQKRHGTDFDNVRLTVAPTAPSEPK